MTLGQFPGGGLLYLNLVLCTRYLVCFIRSHRLKCLAGMKNEKPPGTAVVDFTSAANVIVLFFYCCGRAAESPSVIYDA